MRKRHRVMISMLAAVICLAACQKRAEVAAGPAESETIIETAPIATPAAAAVKGSLTMEEIISLADQPKNQGLLNMLEQYEEFKLPSGSQQDWIYPLSYGGETYQIMVTLEQDETLSSIALTRESDHEWLNIYQTEESQETYHTVLADGEGVLAFLNTHRTMSDNLTFQLPEGLTAGAFHAGMGNDGGNLFLTNDPLHIRQLEELSEHIDQEFIPQAWYSAGGVIRYTGGFPMLTWKDSALIAVELPWNHSSQWGESEPLEGCAEPALFMPVLHGLYTPSSLEEAENLYGPVPEELQTSRMWYLFFAKPDSGVAYSIWLNADLFNKEEAVLLARSVQFTEQAFEE